jgi:bifunctional DNA-binding transcriptional regulator/antitoxin component of YhaV-PrlF toxin-antitoxin module
VRDAPVEISASVLGRLARLGIKRSSTWRVLLAIVSEAVATGEDAHLKIVDIAGLTGLSERSVKTAVSGLAMAGLIVRVGRYGRFAVPMLLDLGGRRSGKPFTSKQERTVGRALRESGLLLGVDDAGSIVMPDRDAKKVGLEAGVTFRRAFETLREQGDRDRARRFVGIVLEFRHSEEVGGRPVF